MEPFSLSLNTSNPSFVEIIFLLIGFSLLVALVFLIAFVWAVKDDQFSDAEGDGMRVLHEEPRP